MAYSTKNIVFSKHGATLTCPVCEKTATYQIGQLDRDKWAMVRGKYKCKECRALPPHTPSFGSLENSKDDLTKLLEMVEI